MKSVAPGSSLFHDVGLATLLLMRRGANEHQLVQSARRRLAPRPNPTPQEPRP